jgi:hypothetical protein
MRTLFRRVIMGAVHDSTHPAACARRLLAKEKAANGHTATAGTSKEGKCSPTATNHMARHELDAFRAEKLQS